MTKARMKWYLSDLNPTYRNHLNSLKDIGEKIALDKEKKLVRAEIRGYLTALNDAGLISDVQFRGLYTYYTINL